jgi:hypothetical protein
MGRKRPFAIGTEWPVQTLKSLLVLSYRFLVHAWLPTDLLWPCFQDHIERRFLGTAKPRKSGLRENLSQAPLTGLRSKGEANLLTE